MSKSKTKNSFQKRELKCKLAKSRSVVRCCFCKKSMPLEDATLEHIVPLSLGGTWKLDNLALSCSGCNTDRGITGFELYKQWRRGHLKERPAASAVIVTDSDLIYCETLL